MNAIRILSCSRHACILRQLFDDGMDNRFIYMGHARRTSRVVFFLEKEKTSGMKQELGHISSIGTLGIIVNSPEALIWNISALDFEEISNMV